MQAPNKVHFSRIDARVTSAFAVLAENYQPIEQRRAASNAGDGENLVGSFIEGGEGVSLERGRRAVDLGTIDAMTATQETLRRQLADMRENLARVSENTIRRRSASTRCLGAGFVAFFPKLAIVNALFILLVSEVITPRNGQSY